MAEPDLKDVVARLERLENSLARIAETRSDGSVRLLATSFALKDPSGTLRATLELREENPGLHLLTVDGQTVASLAITDEGPKLYFGPWGDTDAIGSFAITNTGPALRMIGSSTELSMNVSNEQSSIAFWEDKIRARLVCGLTAKGSFVSLTNSEGKVRILLQTPNNEVDDEVVMSILDDAGTHRLCLSYCKQNCGLAFATEAGRPQVALGLAADQPVMMLKAREGDAALILTIRNDEPMVSMTDAEGRPI